MHRRTRRSTLKYDWEFFHAKCLGITGSGATLPMTQSRPVERTKPICLYFRS